MRHSIGGLFAGFLGGRAGGVLMNIRESGTVNSDPQESRDADTALNNLTTIMGRNLGGENGINFARDLGSWIRNNLCAPTPREGGGRR